MLDVALHSAVPLGLSTLIALYLAPRLIETAERYGLVDEPSPPLKTHSDPVPYLGGLVLYVAFVFALAVSAPLGQEVLVTAVGAGLVMLIGLMDDLGSLALGAKLMGQLMAGTALVQGGVRIELVAVPEPLAAVLSLIWLVTCMNAFNIVDVSDGLATTAGIVGAAGSLCLAVLNHELPVALMAAALLGSCVGFLRFNWEPARMYLGDSGAMLLGAILGAVLLTSKYSEVNVVSALFAPIAIVAVPLFDFTVVTVARARSRKPVYRGSPDHVALRLRNRGLRPAAVAGLAAGAGALVAAIGILSTVAVGSVASALGAVLVIAGTVSLWWVLEFLPAPPIVDNADES